MKKTLKKMLPVSCMPTFAVTAVTFIPLFILYLRNDTMKNLVFQDLHVWFGIFFIIFAFSRITLNRRFVAGSIGQLFRYSRCVSRKFEIIMARRR